MQTIYIAPHIERTASERIEMALKWEDFLQGVCSKEISMAFVTNECPQLSIGLALDDGAEGICLDNKNDLNALGRETTSVVKMVTDPVFPKKFDCLPSKNRPIELEKLMRWKADDASP